MEIKSLGVRIGNRHCRFLALPLHATVTIPHISFSRFACIWMKQDRQWRSGGPFHQFNNLLHYDAHQKPHENEGMTAQKLESKIPKYNKCEREENSPVDLPQCSDLQGIETVIRQDTAKRKEYESMGKYTIHTFDNPTDFTVFLKFANWSKIDSNYRR
jgi:hypothetical protein